MPAEIILGIKSCWVSVPVYFRDLPNQFLSLFPPSLTQLVSHGPLPASLRAAHSSRAPSAAAAAASAARPVQVHVDDAPPLLGQLGPGLKDDCSHLHSVALGCFYHVSHPFILYILSKVLTKF